jgi:hypothetical protein
MGKHIKNKKNLYFMVYFRGLLDRITARYFYKRLKTSLHKPRGNLLENLFSKKCAFISNLQLWEKTFLSQTNTTSKNGILLNKMAHFLDSSISQKLIIKNKSLLNKGFIFYININFVSSAWVYKTNSFTIFSFVDG